MDVCMPAGYGFLVVDMSNKTAPKVVGYVRTPSELTAVALNRTKAYLAESYSGVLVMEISTPSAPRDVAFRDTPVKADNLAA